jgi:CO dehydrogenase/acetyl-CoA synthase beta subunit
MNREHVYDLHANGSYGCCSFRCFHVLVVFLPLISSISCVNFHFTHGIEKRDTRRE